MAHTWKYALGLGLMGAALSVGCTVSSGDDDSGFAGESGAGGSSSGKGGSGGTTSTGGTGGSTGGTGGSTGGTTGGSAGAGTGGSTGGSSGTGGSTGGSGGSTSGTGGSAGTEPTPSCDSTDMGTPWQDCAPGDANKDDPCALCIQHSCCEQSKNCYATDPYNVCGWGGPLMDDPMLADYAGAGEIGCITTCLSEYVTENEVCDTDGIDGCTSMCQTAMCSLVGSATSALFDCMQRDCSSECFGAETCN